MSCPIGWGSPPENVLQVQSCTVFDEEADYFIMAAPSSLVQWCRVGMASHRVVSVWIFARVKQQSNDLDSTTISCQGECQVAFAIIGDWKQSAEILYMSQSRRYGQIHPSATPNQSVHRFQLAMQGCCLDSAVGICSVIAQEID